MKKIKISILFFAIFLTACSLNNSKSTNSVSESNKQTQVSAQNQDSNSQEKTETSNDNASADKTVSNNTPSQNSAQGSEGKAKTDSTQNIAEKVKDYIINGQEAKPSAEKYNWSKTFLDQVDVNSLYKKYAANGGNTNDVESFAKYITLNAPVPSNWQDLFKKDLKDAYGEDVTKLEPLQDDLYQAYVKKNDSEVPFVVVSSRTGYFHG
ncbi:hypothetical protein IAI10_09655 [Clostridium sp. 19966]|uniref:hypothetical protein n=1 Tax=Clostridium sp. 19966 TaxID=2768166 RepID=UPI0028DD68CB|nr:hypothetical protein [Clostridium sp. 19966]MDT8716922.1 hypothetical protein [Clostridium sp. 19966]